MNLSKKPLAMAYVPWQKFENVLDGGCGLQQGTVFEDLIFPFIGSQAACQSLRQSGRQPERQPEYQNSSRSDCGCRCSSNGNASGNSMNSTNSMNSMYGRRCGF